MNSKVLLQEVAFLLLLCLRGYAAETTEPFSSTAKPTNSANVISTEMTTDPVTSEDHSDTTSPAPENISTHISTNISTNLSTNILTNVSTNISTVTHVTPIETSTVNATQIAVTAKTVSSKALGAKHNSTTVKLEKRLDEDNQFNYDDESLRRGGLCIAAILFVMGILVLVCGKVKRIPRCRVNKGSSYEVTKS